MTQYIILIISFFVILIGGCTQSSLSVGSARQSHRDTPNHMKISEEHCKMTPETTGCQQYLAQGGSINTTTHHHMDHASIVTDVVSFIAEMIPHHQEAVDTSTFVLQNTNNDHLKPILESIIKGQTQEIQMMQGRLTQYFSDTDYKPKYMLMMRPLNDLQGAQLDSVYMQDMIAHHQGAVDMAHKILALMKDQDPKIRVTPEMAALRSQIQSFAQTIIDAQTKEIIQFQNLLAQKPL